MNDLNEAGPLHVLAIDDEPQMRRFLTIALEASGYHITTAATGREGLERAAEAQQDLVILDLGLPDLTGVEVLKQLREWTQAPVIILTVQEGSADKVEALDRGADDYLTKPFHTGELLARMRAALRRYDRTRHNEPVYRCRGLEVDLTRRAVSLQGQPVKLTAKEYALLRLFVRHCGKVLTHQQILREVWGAAYERETQYLRVYVARLREKLETNPATAPLFLTEAGVGYRLVEA